MRSKRYQENLKKMDKEKIYGIEEAIEILKSSSKAKFDETIEAHFHLSINPEKTEQQVRAGVELPHGTGKKVVVAVFTEDKDKAAEAKDAGAEIIGGDNLIEKTRTSGSLNADVTVATPDMMPKLAKIAKILGPRGLMPNPKNETVTVQVGKIVSQLKKGKVNYKSDKTGNIHVPVGKVSFESAALLENFDVLKKSLDKAKPATVKGKLIKSISLSSTMGIGIKIG